MTHVVLSPRDTEDGRTLKAAAEARGWTTEVLESWRAPAHLSTVEALAIYGEPLFARIVAAQCGRVLLEPPPTWLPDLPARWRRREVHLARFGEVGALEYPAFVKPPDDKVFAAKVYGAPDDLLSRSDIEPGAQILVSEPVRFAAEFRVHVLEGRAVSCSRYMVQGELSIDGADPRGAAARAFTDDALAEVSALTPAAAVVDVGLMEDGEWAVVEANPAFGAGIYAGDPHAILDVLARACRPAADLPEGERRFTFPLEIE